MKKTVETKSLVGRQIYFKLPKKKLTKSGIQDLTPNKLYTITTQAGSVVWIRDDVGYEIATQLKNSSHLDCLTGWILKRK